MHRGRTVKVKLILPALTEAVSPFWRPIKYSLFPPLGLATLAAHLEPEDAVEIQDEHVENLFLDDEPDLVGIQVYVTSARRAYHLADHYRSRGAFVALGGLHVRSRPSEAMAHADAIFLGPADDTWPGFVRDLRRGNPRRLYISRARTLAGVPPPRRDLIRRDRYLVPNSLVVTRGCPHHCDFCYKDAFYQGGRSFYTRAVDEALAEIESLPGRHLYFLDDHLFGDVRFAEALFSGMRGMGRLWQAAGTVASVLKPGLMERAAESGLRSLFIGFESLDRGNLQAQRKDHNLGRDYEAAIRRLHGLGVMVNASFVFGMDGDDAGVFDRTVAWMIGQGIETGTFHILTPYPGTALHRRLASQGRLLHENWDLYDTRHAVFRPARMTTHQLEAGYWRAYRDFYRWGSILRSASVHKEARGLIRHVLYAGGWKKFESSWGFVIRAGKVSRMLPMLERILEMSGVASAPTSERRLLPRVARGRADR
jgi:radical SAM superfamily enzyme YgiQ (UPF0313 family)